MTSYCLRGASSIRVAVDYQFSNQDIDAGGRMMAAGQTWQLEVKGKVEAGKRAHEIGK
jgi:hypothetical protein